LAAISLLALGSLACSIAAIRTADRSTQASPVDPVVGAWLVHANDAPFAWQVFTFHGDGTMGQANPDAGDRDTSDSDGGGTWRRDSNQITGIFMEMTAKRDTGQFAGWREITFRFTVQADLFSGTAKATSYDMDGHFLGKPSGTPLTGKRVQVDTGATR